MITASDRPLFYVVAQTFDGSLRYTFESYASREAAEAHAAKFNAWHDTHGREKFAYVQVSDNGGRA